MPRAAEGSPVAPWSDTQLSAGHKAAHQSVVILVMGEKIRQEKSVLILLEKRLFIQQIKSDGGGKVDFLW